MSEPEPIAEDRERLRLTGLLLETLVKGTRAVRLYPEGHELREREYENLSRASRVLCEKFGAVKVQLSPSAFYLGAEEVYQDEEKASALSFRLFIDGARQLTFTRPFELAESKLVLDALIEREDTEEDLLARLGATQCDALQIYSIDEFSPQWSADELAIDPTVKQLISELNEGLDELMNELGVDGGLSLSGALSMELEAGAQELRTAIGLPQRELSKYDEEPAEPEPERPFFVLGTDQAWFAREVGAAASLSNKLQRCVAIVLDALKGNAQLMKGDDVSWFLDAALETAQDMRDLGLLAELVTMIAAGSEFKSRIAYDRIDRCLSAMRSAERVEGFIALALDPEALGGDQELLRLVAALGEPAYLVVGQRFPQLADEALRETMWSVICEGAESAPNVLAWALDASVPPQYLRRGLELARQISVSDTLLDALVRLAQQLPEGELKARSIATFRQVSGLAALERALERFQQDESDAGRLNSLGALVESESCEALAALQEIVDQRSFLKRSSEEQEATLRALVALGGIAERDRVMSQIQRGGLIRRDEELAEAATRVLAWLNKERPLPRAKRVLRRLDEPRNVAGRTTKALKRFLGKDE